MGGPAWGPLMTRRGGLGGGGGSGRREHLYNYGRYALLHGRNRHSTVRIKQVSKTTCDAHAQPRAFGLTGRGWRSYLQQ